MARSSNRFAPDACRRAIIQYIVEHPDRPLKVRALARELGVGGADYPAFRELVAQMLADDKLELGRARTLTLPRRGGELVGTFRQHRRGFGFVETPGLPDAYVPRESTGGAWDGDTVAVRLVGGRRSHAGPRAIVTRVVERAPVLWVGVLEPAGGRWVVHPQGRAHAPTVEIEDPSAQSARLGDLVAVEPLEPSDGRRGVRGVIVERLGPGDQTRTKVLGIIRRFAIRDRFPPEVRRAAQRATDRFNPDQLDDREDLRKLMTITIDPPDARDFDDAISIEILRGGGLRLGVHIADVAHFVRPDGPLDREARLRGNSAYLPGHVVPMLPERLSNGVCSLQPDQPRLTMSALLTYDQKARVTDARFCNSVIRSHARLTYEQAADVLAGKRVGAGRAVSALLGRARKLARGIQRRRQAAGMISLNIPEVDIQLDEQGNIVDARPADDSFTHTIIEMFMVEANDAVCRLLTQKRVPHLRRIHPPPEPKAAREFGRLISGVGLPAPANLDRGAIRTLLDSVRGGPSETAVNLLLLRSLSQACYSPERIGHFALASEDYCHFTSPIRRYPDLVVHRALKSYLRGTQTVRERGRRDAGEPDLVELARHTSATERVAQQAEREARKVLLLDLMKSKVGQTLDGTITGVTPAGVFVQVRPYLAEGLVRREDFGSGWWNFDRGRGAFIGQPNGRVIAIGQPVSVLVAAVHELHQELVLVPAVGTSLGVGSTEATGKDRRPAARGVGGPRSRTPRRGRRRTGGAKKRGHQGP